MNTTRRCLIKVGLLRELTGQARKQIFACRSFVDQLAMDSPASKAPKIVQSTAYQESKDGRL